MRSVPWLAGALPLAYYIAAAQGHGGLFEEGSFVAASRGLTVAHAPGAPIETLLGAAFALLPIGPLPFRVAIVSALCTALTLALFARALISTLRHLDLADERFSALLSLGVSLWLGQSALFRAQATRPHMFAVQLALSMLIIYTLLRFEEEEPHGSTRVLYFGAFVQGLCFANHHAYGLLMLPVAAPTLGRVFARRGFIGLLGYMAAPIVGFSVYLYVPLRLAQMPETGLASEHGFARMLAMLSDEPYAGPSWASPVTAVQSLCEGLSLSATQLAALGVLLLLPGLWASMRSSHRRRFGTLWFVAWLVPVASVQWALRPRVMQDAWGALLPAACALSVIATCGLAWIATRLVRLPTRAQSVLGALAVVLGSAGFTHYGSSEARALGAVVDEADDLWRRQLAPSAVLFSADARGAFSHRGGEAEESLRADLSLVPLATSTPARAIEAWAAESPELADTLRAFVLTGELASGPLQSLNALRPVYVEPSESRRAALSLAGLPDGLLFRVRSEGVTQRDLREAGALQVQRVARLRRLCAQLPEALLERKVIERALLQLELTP